MPVVSSFAGNSLLHQSGGFEPLRKSNFSVIFHGIDDGGSTLVLSLRDTNVPAWSVRRQGVKYFNETMHYAGSVAPFADHTLSFMDFVDRNVLSLLEAWKKKVWDYTTGGIGSAANYKTTGDIYLLPPGGNGTSPSPVNATDGARVWHLEGCFPTSLSYDNLTQSDEGTPVMIKLTVSIDRAYPIFGSISGTSL